MAEQQTFQVTQGRSRTGRIRCFCPRVTVAIFRGIYAHSRKYRVNGFLYAIKVIPTSGAPYYLVAVDEDGNYVRSDQPDGLRIPSWKIFEW